METEIVAVEWRQKCIIICTDEFDALLCCLPTLAKTVSAAVCVFAYQLRFDIVVAVDAAVVMPMDHQDSIRKHCYLFA